MSVLAAVAVVLLGWIGWYCKKQQKLESTAVEVETKLGNDEEDTATQASDV